MQNVDKTFTCSSRSGSGATSPPPRGEAVKVAVRFRPPPTSPSEEDNWAPLRHLEVNEAAREVTVFANTSAGGSNVRSVYTFDAAFRGGDQGAVYAAVAAPVVHNTLRGYNGAILAAGQSGSGKTHTMFGPCGGTVTALRHEHDSGIVPRALRDLLSLAAAPPGVLSSVHDNIIHPQESVEGSLALAAAVQRCELSALELHNEEIIDLLDDRSNVNEGATAGPLRIREDCGSGGRGVFVENLTAIPVADPAAALAAIVAATARRHVSETKLNQTSSRSHTVVTLRLQMVDPADEGARTTSQLILVDLAGNERLSRTGAVGERLREAQCINLSLSSLGVVISKLTDPAALHVPFRDSKLTRLLQDSLGGNSKTTLICTCSSRPADLTETVATLQFAQRAKAVRNAPRVNREIPVGELRRHLDAAAKEIAVLKAQLSLLRGVSAIAEAGAAQPRSVPACVATSATAVATLSPSNATGREEQELVQVVGSLTNELAIERRERITLETEITALKKRSSVAAAKIQDLEAELRLALTQLENEKIANELLRDEMSPTRTPVAPLQDSALARRCMSASAKLSRRPAHEREVRNTEFCVAPPPPRPRLAISRRLKLGRGPSTDAADLADDDASLAAACLKEVEEAAQRDLSGRDKIIADLQAKLAASQQQQQQQAAATAIERTAASNIQARAVPEEVAAEIEHLERESRALHAENRANATRLLEFTRQIDALTKENAALRRAQQQQQRGSGGALPASSTAGGCSSLRRRLQDCLVGETS